MTEAERQQRQQDERSVQVKYGHSGELQRSGKKHGDFRPRQRSEQHPIVSIKGDLGDKNAGIEEQQPQKQHRKIILEKFLHYILYMIFVDFAIEKEWF